MCMNVDMTLAQVLHLHRWSSVCRSECSIQTNILHAQASVQAFTECSIQTTEERTGYSTFRSDIWTDFLSSHEVSPISFHRGRSASYYRRGVITNCLILTISVFITPQHLSTWIIPFANVGYNICFALGYLSIWVHFTFSIIIWQLSLSSISHPMGSTETLSNVPESFPQ